MDTSELEQLRFENKRYKKTFKVLRELQDYCDGDPLYNRVRGISLDYARPGGSEWSPFLIRTIMDLNDRLIRQQLKYNLEHK